MSKTKKAFSIFEQSVYAHLADLPYTTTTELTRFRGFPSEQQVYRALKSLERAGYVLSVKHFPATSNIPRIHKTRYFIGAQGITDFAGIFNTTPDVILNHFPCSSDWQRTLLRRLDSVAMIYDLCLKILDVRPVAMPLTIRFPRDSDFDGMVVGGDGLCVGFMRMGNTMNRREFGKRFWAIKDGRGTDNWQRRGPPLTLVLVPTTYAKRWLGEDIDKRRVADKVPCAIATEYEALNLEVDATTWVKLDPQVSGQSFKSLIEDLQIDSTYKLIYHNEFKRVYPPRALSKVKAYDLRATHKKILTCLADWPMMKRVEINRMLTGKESKELAKNVKDAIAYLRASGFIQYDKGTKNLIVADHGLRYLSQRDRIRLGALRKNWGPDSESIDKLRKERSHTEGINEVVSRIHTQHPGRIEALPDHESTRRYSIGRRQWRQVRPDAALLLRLGGDTQTVHLEYETRGSRGGKPLFTKVHVWMMYYIFKGRQFAGTVTTQENPLDLLDEVTVFIVPTDGMRQRIMQIGQGMLKKARWTPENSAMIPIAVTTFREYEEAKSILTEKIWFRIDDYHLRPTNPILSERQRASPSKSRRR